MKFLEKIALVIYSNIILILSIVLCLLIFGWLDMNLIGNIIYKVIVGDVSSKNITRNKCSIYFTFNKMIYFLIQHQKEKQMKNKEFC